VLELLLLGQKTAADWFWDFRSGAIPPGATFTRGSSGWYFNSAGVLTSASSNVARFDYDPATLSPLGYLAEMQSTNLLLRSEAFDNAAWSKTTSSVSADQAVAPDGNTTMDKLIEDATASAPHSIAQQFTLAGDTYTAVSVFAKAGTRTAFHVTLYGTTNDWVSAVFNLSNGTASQTATGSTSGTLLSASIRSIGGGLYRCSLIAKVTTANPFQIIGLANAATGNTFSGSGGIAYNGDGASYVYLWGAQAKPQASASPPTSPRRAPPSPARRTSCRCR
jgi:hypothetical protein